jgi:hypothetical protein
MLTTKEQLEKYLEWGDKAKVAKEMNCTRAWVTKCLEANKPGCQIVAALVRRAEKRKQDQAALDLRIKALTTPVNVHAILAQ